MNNIAYVDLDKLNPEDLLAILNKQKTREHLIGHHVFDSSSINLWIESKLDMDRINGCRVRGIILNNSLAGWCGIQFEEGDYEIAIVLDDKFWGIGLKVFKDILNWARELGHSEVYIHLLETRPEYKFLHKISKNVFKTEMLGNKFTSYQIEL